MLWKHENRSAVLWLTGNAGCGKTVLTNFLVQDLVEQERVTSGSGSSSLICSFFCTRDKEAQHDVRSLLRDLIRQMLTSMKAVVHQIKGLFGSDRHEYDPSFETLWRIFERLIHLAPPQQVFVAIDALDECDERSKRRLISRLMEIMATFSESGAAPVKRIKVIISGQSQIRNPYLSSAVIGQFHLDIEQKPDGLIQDINRFIDLKVSELVEESVCSDLTATALGLSLKSMSENSFLWLRVVFEHIKTTLNYRDADIMQLLSDVPLDLQEAYTKYLPSISPNEVQVLQRYLKLIIASARPLTPQEMHSFATLGSPSELINGKVVMSSLKRALGPLVKFPHSTIQLVHSTAKKFLILLQSQIHHSLYASHAVDPVRAQLFCAVSCMRYLTHDAISDFSNEQVSRQGLLDDSPISARSRGEVEGEDTMLTDIFYIEDVKFLKTEDALHNEFVAAVQEQFGAYDYAARYWTYHFAKSEHIAEDTVIDQALKLLDCTPDSLSNWYKYVSQTSQADMPPFHELNAVVLAAVFGLTRLVRVLLGRAIYTATDVKLHTALFWAAARGNCGSIQALLDYGVPAQNTNSDKGPLAVAIRGGFLDACRLLLDSKDADPNTLDCDGNPPLVIAASFDHSSTLALLLQQPSIRVNLPDASDRTALSHACVNGSRESVNALLQDDRSEINTKDSRGRTPLHRASQSGNDYAVRSLLGFRDLEVDAVDIQGRNALSLAAQNGHLSVVRRLCHRGLSAEQRDLKGRNAVSWASNSAKSMTHNGSDSVLQYLVQRFPVAADTPDESGWTPLAWAMDPPGYVEAVKVLLQSGHVDANKRDGTYGRSILAWAASQGYRDIVQVLLNVPGIERNSLSSDGRSALSYAAANGMLEIVMLLLKDEEIVVNQKDSSGQSPLNWARLNNCTEIIEALESAQADRSRDRT